MTSETIVPPVSPLQALRFAAGTDIGLRREENQDAHGIIEGGSFRAFFVCDGMGGVQGGAIASNLAIATIREFLKDRSAITELDIASAVTQANANIFERGASEPGLAGMGTTCVGLIFSGERLIITNVGDSRAYRIRGQEVQQLTEDHTLVQELVRSGAITPEQAGNHPVSHMLTRSLGPTPSIDVDCMVSAEGPQRGDRYLICCDGLYNLVGSEEFLDILESFNLDDAVQELIDLANLRGGTDNITLIVVEVGEGFPVGAETNGEMSLAHDLSQPPSNGTSAAAEELSEESGADVEGVEDSTSIDGAAGPESVETDRTTSVTDEIGKGATSAGEVRRENGASPRVNATAAAAGASKTPPEQEIVTGIKRVPLTERIPQLRELLSSFVTLIAVLGVGYGIGIVTSQYTGEEEGPMMQALPKATPVKESPSRNVVAEPSGHDGPTATVSVPEPPPIDLSTHVATLNAAAERERVTARHQTLKRTVADLDAKIQSFNKPISGSLGETIVSTRKAIETIEGELEQVRADLDLATRRLAVWYGRRKRLQEADPINLASEVAVAAPDVRKSKDAFEQATWAYLKEAEVLRYTPGDKTQGEKVALLARERSEKMNALGQTVRGAIEREVGLADRQISELTIKRDEKDSELIVLRRELEYVKVLTGADASARASKRSELEREREVAAAELAGLDSVLAAEAPSSEP